MAQGMAQGMAQRNREIARAMTAANYPLSEIARLLGLSESDGVRCWPPWINHKEYAMPAQYPTRKRTTHAQFLLPSSTMRPTCAALPPKAGTASRSAARHRASALIISPSTRPPRSADRKKRRR